MNQSEMTEEVDSLVAASLRSLAISLPDTPQLRATVASTVVLLPHLDRWPLAYFALLGVWVNWTDALVDSESSGAAAPLPERHSSLHDFILAGFLFESKRATDELAMEMGRFLDAQIYQRSERPLSYLGYLRLRQAAQGIPLVATAAALLLGEDSYLHTARFSQICWWVGCYTGLGNDVVSLPREIDEGVAWTANAYGALSCITGSELLREPRPDIDAIVRSDIATAWRAVNEFFDDRSSCTETDLFMLRLVELVRQEVHLP
jgi:hypothetical protein